MGAPEHTITDQEIAEIIDSICNTTLEALLHASPVITLPGNTVRGRRTSAIL
jgi:hypothetical protein